jgi:hypothetical protein
VIGAAEIFGAAAGFGDDRGGVMAADVIEGAEFAVIAADDHEGFFVDVDGEELAGLLNLIEAADDLPVGGEDTVALELFDALVEIPGRRDGMRFFEGSFGIVEIQDFADAALIHKG